MLHENSSNVLIHRKKTKVKPRHYSVARLLCGGDRLILRQIDKYMVPGRQQLKFSVLRERVG
jgi:hypothetical protein